MEQSSAQGAPWHFWAVGLVSLIWNAFGAYDYTMSMLRDPAYLGDFPPEIFEFLNDMSAWEIGLWSIGVWTAVMGSILLLLRTRFAVWAFGVSLIAALGSFAFQFSRDLPAALDTPAARLIPLVVTVVAVFLLVYAMRARRQGLLS